MTTQTAPRLVAQAPVAPCTAWAVTRCALCRWRMVSATEDSDRWRWVFRCRRCGRRRAFDAAYAPASLANPRRVRRDSYVRMLKRFFGTPAIAPTERELLDTIRDTVIPDPASLRERLAVLTRQIDDEEREWERLDRRGDSSAFLALQPVAERLKATRALAAPLPMLIESAGRRRVAFLALARLFDAVAADVSARVKALVETPPQDARARVDELRALDQATRVHSRLASRLAAVSTSHRFKDPPDAVRLVREDLELRIRELERLRGTGMRAPLAMPAQMTELWAAVEGRDETRQSA